MPEHPEAAAKFAAWLDSTCPQDFSLCDLDNPVALGTIVLAHLDAQAAEIAALRQARDRAQAVGLKSNIERNEERERVDRLAAALRACEKAIERQIETHLDAYDQMTDALEQARAALAAEQAGRDGVTMNEIHRILSDEALREVAERRRAGITPFDVKMATELLAWRAQRAAGGEAVFTCPSCGDPSARVAGVDLDIHSGATYECDRCHAAVIFEAFTPEQYVARFKPPAPAPMAPNECEQCHGTGVAPCPKTWSDPGCGPFCRECGGNGVVACCPVATPPPVAGGEGPA